MQLHHPEFTELSEATDFPPGCCLVITGCEDLPGLESGTEWQLFLVPKLDTPSVIAEDTVYQRYDEYWKVPCAFGGSRFLTEDEKELVWTYKSNAKVVILSEALDVAIKARSLPAVLLIIQASIYGFERAMRKGQDVVNLAIMRMQQRAAAFAVEILQQPLSSFVAFNGDTQREASFVKSLTANFRKMDKDFQDMVGILFKAAMDACYYFDKPGDPTIDLYCQSLSNILDSAWGLLYNAGLNAYTRAVHLMKSIENDDCKEDPMEAAQLAARWLRKAEKYLWTAGREMRQADEGVDMQSIANLDLLFLGLYAEDPGEMISKGRGCSIWRTKESVDQ
uniref:Uncharacterized protein n=1 Tax=Chromera velia CCMP2878 TaxID=1169474 RepID=A0A0G4GSK4_9ALVE|eukprot:Cvel_23146.t1-p1 / transcript=Cvel_23146.t1 / gene=Cvel_23146 / organism=Chromera_velia_CCMP2878 / gene_product=hypothetical protein / transcript_product=hypothetical protein / location=Cvel_scaffold2353:28104-29108(+) / protein_length=335 / sequence_SO=supercontig / SO=protein_coding / is_pseudo=false